MLLSAFFHSFGGLVLKIKMSQRRNTNVFLAALVSVVIGLFVLKSLEQGPIKAKAFSLSDYQRLGSIENFFSSDIIAPLGNWTRVEIYYYDGNDRERSRAEGGIGKYDYRNCHFVIWNGFIGGNGQVQSSENWRKQLPCYGNDLDDDEGTIAICIVTDGNSLYPTDAQVKRVETLAEAISRKFDISPECISYPGNWR